MKALQVVASFAVLLAGPVIVATLPETNRPPVWSELPEISGCTIEDWQFVGWKPEIGNGRHESLGTYVCGAEQVHVAIRQSDDQRQESEVVGGKNHLLPALQSSLHEKLTTSNAKLTVDAYVFGFGEGHDLALWSWYSVGTTATNNRYIAKLLEVRNRVFLKNEISSVVVVAGQSSSPAGARLSIERVSEALWSSYIEEYPLAQIDG